MVEQAVFARRIETTRSNLIAPPSNCFQVTWDTCTWRKCRRCFAPLVSMCPHLHSWFARQIALASSCHLPMGAGAG